MSDFILGVDRDLFLFVNQGLTNDVFDAVMPVVTDLHHQPLFWAAVTAWIVTQITVPAFWNRSNFQTIIKSAALSWAKGLIVLALSMGLADMISYRGVKTWVQRDRPEALGLQPTLRTHSHSGWSFPSNHSANNFALARTVQFFSPCYAIAAYVFAFVVAFSRVYVGVHFPGDVVAGAAIGLLSATLVCRAVAELRRRRERRSRTDSI